jgi:hypothetical protein
MNGNKTILHQRKKNQKIFPQSIFSARQKYGVVEHNEKILTLEFIIPHCLYEIK